MHDLTSGVGEMAGKVEVGGGNRSISFFFIAAHIYLSNFVYLYLCSFLLPFVLVYPHTGDLIPIIRT